MITRRGWWLVLPLLAWNAHPALSQQGPRNRPPSFESPEVRPDRTIVARLFAPEAKSVRFAGSDIPSSGPPGGGAEMTKNDQGVWEAVIGPVPPGTYRYNFLMDGVAVIDPRNPATSESNTNTWSLVTVPGSPVSDLKDVPHGAVAEVPYFSKSLNKFRRMHVYTPPGYERGNEALPVFYLLHGASDSDASWSTVGRAGLVLDNLIAAGEAKPMIVVMPMGHTGPFRFGEGNSFQRQMEEFVTDFNEDIRPLVERTYRVLDDRKHRAIAGLSMGGAQTLEIAMGDLGDFGAIGVFSSGVFGIAGPGPGGGGQGPSWEERHAEALSNPDLKKGLDLFWFATGTEDFLIDTTRATVKMLESRGFDVTYEETDGGHTWIKWREHYLPEFARLLFREDAADNRSQARRATLEGAWETTFDTQIGPQEYVFHFRADGESLTGTATAVIGGESFSSKIVEGSRDGDQVRFVEELEFQGTPLRIEYSGTLAGDTMTLTRKVGDFAEESLTARRRAQEPARETPRRERQGEARRQPAGDTRAEVTLDAAPEGFDQPRSEASKGRVETIEYDSKTVGIPRKMVVYTPPGYTTDRRYPVLYLLHGIGDTEVGWTRERAHVILDNLIADNLIEPMIVVMPYGRASATPVPANIFDRGEFETYGKFEEEILRDVIPTIEARYSVKPDRESRALAGLSMGGGQSLNIGLAHLDTFAWVGGFSSAPNTKRASEAIQDPATAARQLRLLWVSCGDRDNLMGVSRDFHEALDAMEVPHTWHVSSGGHDFRVWRNDLYHFAQKLFR